MGFNSPTDNPFVQLPFEGCQWLCETETTKKESVTSDMIKTLVTKYDEKSSSIPDLRFLVKCLLGFTGFLPVEELLVIKLKHKSTREKLRNFNPKIKSRSTQGGTCRLHFQIEIRMLSS